MNKTIIIIGLILLMSIVVGCVEPKQVHKLNLDDCQVIEMEEKTWGETTIKYFCADGMCCHMYNSWGGCDLARCYLEDTQKG